MILLQTIPASTPVMKSRPPSPLRAPHYLASAVQTMNGGEGVRASDAVALNCQEHRDSIWLNVDHFSDSHLEFKVGAAEDKSEAMRDIEDKSGSDGDKVGQPEDGPQEMDYSIDEAEDGPEDGDGIAHNVKDVITDPVMDEIEVDDGDAEGWWHLRASSNRS